MNKILLKKYLNEQTVFMRLENNLIPLHFQAGQFLIVRCDEKSERIPLTIVDTTVNSVDILFQVLGYSTKKLSNLQVGDRILDVVGPLGKPSKIGFQKKILAICGGVGSAPLYPQLKKANEQNCLIDLVIGGKNQSNLYLIDEYKEFVKQIHICTDDGSLGFKGNVLEYLRQNLTENYDESIIIGPAIMMKLCVDFVESRGIKTFVSLNPIMIDGTGMCGECRVKIGEKVMFTCIDGPDFCGKEVDFDELINRQKFYRSKETHICKIKEKI